MKLDGKIALITGGGSGIGRATALALATRGTHLVLFGRTASKLEATADLAASHGVRVETIGGNVADETACMDALETVRARFGRLDILVNNAGNVRAGRLETTAVADIRAMIEIDLVAPILWTRAALPLLRASGDGAIVNVTSGIALVGAPFYATYAAAKAGLARFGEALHRELLDEGVRVLTVYPGATDTPMMSTNKAGPDLGFARETPEMVADALVDGLVSDAREVIRANETRRAMIALNRDHPEQVDERFRAMKARLEAAVSGHHAP
ncbi:MAG: SDR family oxidoreductase [Bradyrhizobium sp.]